MEATGGLLPDDADPVVDGILAAAPLLAICSNLGIAVYDCNTWDCLDFRSYAGLSGPLALATLYVLHMHEVPTLDCHF